MRGWGAKQVRVRSKAQVQSGKKNKDGKRKIKKERKKTIKFLAQLIRDRPKVKWSKIAGECSMEFKVLISSE